MRCTIASTAENERSAQLRSVYAAIGISVTVHKNGTLVLRWSRGARTLPGVTDSERPVTPGSEWGFSALLPPGGAATVRLIA